MCLCLLFTCGMQSAGKTNAFLQSKVMPKSHHILRKYVQPVAPGCVGAPAHSSSPQSCHPSRQPRHCGEGHNLCCCWWALPQASKLTLQGRKGPLQKKLLFPSLLQPLFSINEMASSHRSSSLTQSISYCAFGVGSKNHPCEFCQLQSED